MFEGVVIFLIAFLGCFGAVKNSSCMVYTYSTLLLIVLVAEIAAGVAAYVLKDNLDRKINEKMIESMDNYGKADYGFTRQFGPAYVHNRHNAHMHLHLHVDLCTCALQLHHLHDPM